MEKEAAAGSGIARQPAQADGVEKDDTPPSGVGVGGGSTCGGAPPPPRARKKDWTPEERRAAKEFIRALLDDYEVYAAMTEDDVEEEYRRAGKLHKYDPEMELKKRCARVGKKHPPPPGYYPVLEQYFKLIEDDED